MKPSLKLVGAAFGLAACLAHGATVNLQYEQADSPSGPWRSVPSSEQTRQADGSIAVESSQIRYYRLSITPSGTNAPSIVRLGTLPTDSALRLNNRLSELSRFLRPLTVIPGDDTNPPLSEIVADLAGVEAWRNATFASNAIPIFDPAYRNGLEPAYLEIKVLGASGRRRSGVDGTTRALTHG